MPKALPSARPGDPKRLRRGVQEGGLQRRLEPGHQAIETMLSWPRPRPASSAGPTGSPGRHGARRPVRPGPAAPRREGGGSRPRRCSGSALLVLAVLVGFRLLGSLFGAGPVRARTGRPGYEPGPGRRPGYGGAGYGGAAAASCRACSAGSAGPWPATGSTTSSPAAPRRRPRRRAPSVRPRRQRTGPERRGRGRLGRWRRRRPATGAVDAGGGGDWGGGDGGGDWGGGGGDGGGGGRLVIRVA